MASPQPTVQAGQHSIWGLLSARYTEQSYYIINIRIKNPRGADYRGPLISRCLGYASGTFSVLDAALPALRARRGARAPILASVVVHHCLPHCGRNFARDASALVYRSSTHQCASFEPKNAPNERFFKFQHRTTWAGQIITQGDRQRGEYVYYDGLH